MRFLCLIYASERDWDALAEEERRAIYARYRAFGEEAGERVVAGAELRPAATATTVRVREGDTTVSDGPFVETKEQLGGYYVLECESLDEAVALAARIPGAAHGAVEVRPASVEGEEAAA